MNKKEYFMLSEMHPILLNNCHERWLIEAGKVDLFIVQLVDGYPFEQRRHLCRLGPGELLRGLDNINTKETLGILATGSPETWLRGIDKNDKKQILSLTDDWLIALTSKINRAQLEKFNLANNNSRHVLKIGEQIALQDGILWIIAEQAALEWLPSQQEISMTLPFPVTPTTWIRANEETTIRCCNSSVLGSMLESAVAAFHTMLLKGLQKKIDIECQLQYEQWQFHPSRIEQHFNTDGIDEKMEIKKGFYFEQNYPKFTSQIANKNLYVEKIYRHLEKNPSFQR